MDAAVQSVIEQAFAERAALTPANAPAALRAAVHSVLDALEAGSVRAAVHEDGQWVAIEWVKKAILLSFRITENQLIAGAPQNSFDKLPLRFAETDRDGFARTGARVVPGALVRRGAFVGADAVLMPSYLNVGAYVGAGTMIDTWATVGSCAQIGERVHLSGGAGIGGVLEPLQATPTIIEDDCFIGARSEVVEGVIVEHGSVLGMGVFLSQSTRIYNRATGEVSMGRVPAGSVVVAGSLPSADGTHSLYAAIIVKQVDAKTRSKTSANELLRSVEGDR